MSESFEQDSGVTPEQPEALEQRERIKEEAAEYVVNSFREAIERYRHEGVYRVGGVEREATNDAELIIALADAELKAAEEVLGTVRGEVDGESADSESQEIYYQEKAAQKLVTLLEHKKNLAVSVAGIESSDPTLAAGIREEISGLEAMVHDVSRMEEAVTPS